MTMFAAPKFGAFAAALTVALAAPGAGAQAATLIAGGLTGCDEGACFAGNTYRQAFSLTGGKFNISDLKLAKALLGENLHKIFKVSFETANGDVVGTWGSFMIAGLGGDVVTLGGEAFEWQDGWGDLVLRLDLKTADKGGGGGGGGGGFFAFGPPGGGHHWGTVGDGGAPPWSQGAGAGLPSIVEAALGERPANPIFGPDVAIASPNPEPSAWAMMILGFGAAGSVIRARRRTLWV